MDDKVPTDKKDTAIEKAQAILDKIEKANAATQAWVERAEALRAEQLLSGKAEAGQTPPAQKEETPAEYTARIMRGQ